VESWGGYKKIKDQIIQKSDIWFWGKIYGDKSPINWIFIWVRYVGEKVHPDQTSPLPIFDQEPNQ
jgi:hypothetical protein